MPDSDPPRRLLRTLRLDDSDARLFPRAAQADEWAVPGSFVFTFSERDPARLTGAEQRAFSSGFLGLDSLGWSTLVVVAEISPAQYRQARTALAAFLRRDFGAPDDAEALRVAQAQLADAAQLCEHPVNTVISVVRECTPAGISERFVAHTRRPVWQTQTRIFRALPDDQPDN
jgi:hypothetical protein